MNYKSFILTISLWIAVESISFLVFIYRGIQEAKAYQMKKIYIKRLLYFLEKKIPREKLLNELYYSVQNNKGMQKLILEAIKRGSIDNGLTYIENKLGCVPIYNLHKFILCDNVAEDGLKGLYEQLEIWKTERKGVKTAYRKNKIAIVIQCFLFNIAMFLLYFEVKNEITLYISIIVNTISVILLIVLDYEGIDVDKIINDGKNATRGQREKKTLAPAIWLKNSFQIAGCTGLIINIAMIFTHFLGQVI